MMNEVYVEIELLLKYLANFSSDNLDVAIFKVHSNNSNKKNFCHSLILS